jgi:hypothetical protein
MVRFILFHTKHFPAQERLGKASNQNLRRDYPAIRVGEAAAGTDKLRPSSAEHPENMGHI